MRLLPLALVIVGGAICHAESAFMMVPSSKVPSSKVTTRTIPGQPYADGYSPHPTTSSFLGATGSSNLESDESKEAVSKPRQSKSKLRTTITDAEREQRRKEVFESIPFERYVEAFKGPYYVGGKIYDDEVKKPVVEPSSNTSSSTGVVDSSETKGHNNRVRLPHFRQSCPEQKFMALSNFRFQGKSRSLPPWALIGKDGNAERCNMCHCYVCDKPAQECERWSSSEHSSAYFNHCHASNNGPLSKEWNKMRQLYKEQSTDRISEIELLDANDTSEQPLPESLPAVIRVGAFSPDNQRAFPFFNQLTKCRKCGWYSTATEKWSVDAVEYCPADWCHACGRVASEASFNIWTKRQPYEPEPTDIYLGTKVIPFRIKAHDPRKMKMFQKNWARLEGTSPEWIYDEAEAEEEVFLRRLGTYPSLEMILGSIPILREDKIPTDGLYREWSIGWVKEQMAMENEGKVACETANDEDDEYNNSFPPEVLAADTDAILMDRDGVSIFQELSRFGSVNVPKDEQDEASIAGDIMAKWNREERCGEFVVRLFGRDNDQRVTIVGPLLGAWFDVLPFALPSLGRGIKASSRIARLPYEPYPFPPFNPTEIENVQLVESIKDEMNDAVKKYNEEIEESLGKLSLQSSNSDASCLGGVCSADTSFAGILHRYVAEILPDHVDAHLNTYSPHEFKNALLVSWLGRAAGITSHHRTMGNIKEDFSCDNRYVSLKSCIREKDIPLMFVNLSGEGIKTMKQTTAYINGLLVHLENLGHDEASAVDGLNVDLLPFQLQTLQWALDREKTPGGLQSFLSAKLPLAEDVYYHPVFESVSKKKPKLVRGGIIADETGLGKTVVSLALIMQNPAPTEPASGAKAEKVSEYFLKPSESGWDCDWQVGEDPNPLKSSIVSRGTLVVCHVSLVKKWTEEASSKLNDPGLVYAYHGQNRTRDAMILAENTIIVTTYATLAADASYHAGKALKNGESSYCPPCEQIRWWRIICDESHILKYDTVQTKAVMNLVGDHKWAVSGTPWSTSLRDIKNQLKFVGLEDVDLMFDHFQNSVFQDVNEESRRHRIRNKHADDRKLGHFLFLMRGVMIRHSHKQQYRGTSRTLMSLPLKTERTIMIDFEPLEAKEYAKLEKKALGFYQAFNPKEPMQPNRHYVKMMQQLAPLRIACAGGRIPLTKQVARPVKKAEFDDPDQSNDAPINATEKKSRTFSKFRFRSKFNVLIEELKKIRDNEPNSKSLVFSQFASSLKFMQEELPKHGFQFSTLTDAMTMNERAEFLHDFEDNPSSTILLLSMRLDAVGINLTKANRVFLLEPAMNPALTEQAVGCVHRLGQTRHVEIIRLLMKDSVETRISQLVDEKVSMGGAMEVELDGNDIVSIPAGVSANAPIVSSVRTNKATITAAEYGFLFGVDSN